MNTTQPVIINPHNTVQASIIWLHGLGADGYDFVDIIPQLKLPEDLAVRFIFPHAPIRPVTLNNGYEMRAWFDIHSLAIDAPQDTDGLSASQHLVEQLINQELAAGIPSKKIILAGFSQGAALALHTGLAYSKQLAGILALSGFLMQDSTTNINPGNKATPIYMLHGEFDNVVQISWGKATRDNLQKHGLKVKWSSYPMQHGICLEEINDISKWIQNLLSR